MVSIVQTLVAGASEYERKSQRIDREGLSGKHEVTLVDADKLHSTAASVVHIYGPFPIPATVVSNSSVPFVANAPVGKRRLRFRRSPQPAMIVSPLGPPYELLPEAVEENWFQVSPWGAAASAAQGRPRTAAETAAPHRDAPHRETKRVGTFARPGIGRIIDLTLARIHRFRDDIEWVVFDHPPTPDDLKDVDLWADPTSDDFDYNGFVAEAYVFGKSIVASRTPINLQRLENGRCGFVVPVNDPNELCHAILTALFKPEVAQQKISAARQTVGKFRPRQRIRVLERMYEALTR